MVSMGQQQHVSEGSLNSEARQLSRHHAFTSVTHSAITAAASEVGAHTSRGETEKSLATCRPADPSAKCGARKTYRYSLPHSTPRMLAVISLKGGSLFHRGEDMGRAAPGIF